MTTPPAEGITRRALLALGVLMLGTLVLDSIFFVGFYASDDISYVSSVNAIARDFGLNRTIGGVRLGVNLPAAIVYRLSGFNLGWVVYSYIGYHVALVALAFFAGVLAHSRRVGFVAAGLVATCPVFYLFAGAMLPDNATSCWVTVSMIALLMAWRRGQRLQPMRLAETAVLMACAGGAVGLAYMVKETGLIFAVPGAVAIIAIAGVKRPMIWIRNGAFFALGLLLVVGAEHVMLRMLSGEWFFRLGILFESTGGEAAAIHPFTNPFDRAAYAHRRLTQVAPVGFWVLLAGLVTYSFTPGARAQVAIYGLWPAFYLTWGTTNPTVYYPPSIQTRYYAPVMLPAALMAAYALVWMLDALRRVEWKKWKWKPTPKMVGGLAAALIAAVFVSDLRTTLPSAGNVYGADMARGFLNVYTEARDRYPHLPIVLSAYYSRRMGPLFFDEQPDDVYVLNLVSSGIGLAEPPDPPYVFLDTAVQNVHYLPGGIPRVVPDFDPENTRVTTVDVVYAPPTRSQHIATEIGRALRVSVPPSPGNEFSHRSGALIQLVEPGPPSDADPFAFNPAWVPLFPIGKDGRGVVTRRFEDGYLVEWPGDVAPGGFYVQLFDASSYKRTPGSPFAVVPGEGRSVQLDLEAVTSTPIHIDVNLYAFGENGLLHYERTRHSVPEAGPLSAAVCAEEPVTMFRTRIKIRPSERRAGSVRLTGLEANRVVADDGVSEACGERTSLSTTSASNQ